MKKHYEAPEITNMFFPCESVLAASTPWSDPLVGDVGQDWFWNSEVLK